MKCKLKNCRKEFFAKDKRTLFCSRSCATIFNKTGKKLSEKAKLNISTALKKVYKEKPEIMARGEKHSKAVGKATKGKYKSPSSLLDLSSRTISKIFKRMKLGCSRCGWQKGSCDIHHINGRKVENANGHWNLTYICPNCHREYHSGNVDIKKEFVTIENYIGDKWKEFYYG